MAGTEIDHPLAQIATRIAEQRLRGIDMTPAAIAAFEEDRRAYLEKQQKEIERFRKSGLVDEFTLAATIMNKGEIAKNFDAQLSLSIPQEPTPPTAHLWQAPPMDLLLTWDEVGEPDPPPVDGKYQWKRVRVAVTGHGFLFNGVKVLDDVVGNKSSVREAITTAIIKPELSNWHEISAPNYVGERLGAGREVVRRVVRRR